MSATDWLDPLNWGTGVAETTDTLGEDRLDVREPPTLYHVGNLQITRVKNAVLGISQYLKGGARLRVLPQSSSPFGTGESGFWIDQSGTPKYASNGVSYTLGSGAALTLSGSYNAGGALADSTITLNSTNGRVIIQDASSTIGTALFEVGSNGLATSFFSVGNDGGNKVTRSNNLTTDPNGSASSFYALLFDNPTAATLVNQSRYSAAVEFRARAWDTTSSVERDHRWLVNARPIAGSSTKSELGFYSRYTASGNYTLRARMRDGATAADRWTIITDAPKLLSEATTGAQPAFVLDTTNSYAGTENTLELRDVGNKAFGVRPSSSGTRLQGYNSSSGAATAYIDFLTTGVQVQAGLAVVPETSVASGATLGSSSKVWRESWSRERGGVEQTVTYSATPSFDTTLGETLRMTLTGNISSWAVTNGKVGQVVTLILIQDGTGSRTLSSPPSNVKLQGAGFTLSTAANAVDSLTLRWDNTLTQWTEIGRSRYDGLSTTTTFATAYTNASGASGELVTLDSTRGGINFKDAASSIGSMLAGQTNAGSAGQLWNFTGNDSHTLRSNVADGASAVGIILDTVSTLSNGTAKLASLRNGGSEKIAFSTSGAMTVVNGFSIAAVSGSSSLSYLTNAIVVAGPTLRVNLDLNTTLGNSTSRFSEAWVRRYAGVEQTIAAASSITLNPASGGTMRVTLGATAITTVNHSTGYPNETIRVEIIQDATGGRSISGWSSSFVFETAYTVTSTANKRDILTFLWDNTDSKWYEVGRKMAL